MAEQQAAVRIAEELRDALTGMSGRLDQVRRDSEERDEEVRKASEERDAELKKYGRHNRVFIAIDILLTVVTTFAVFKAVGASDQASQNHQAAIVSCQSTNEARTQNLQLWTFLIDLSHPSPNATPAQKAADVKLLALLRSKVQVTFRPRDCAALASGQKP